MTKISSKTSSKQATFLALGSIFFWCFSGVCFRKGAELMGAMLYLTFMSGGGSLTVVILRLSQGKTLKEVFSLPKRVMLTGFFGVALYTVMLALAFGMAEPHEVGLINLINYLWPIWIVLLGMVLLGERPNVIVTLTGVALGFLGVMVSKGFDQIFAWPDSVIPHLLALFGALFWAIYSVLIKRWSIPEEKSGPAFHFMVCALVAFGIALYNGEVSNLSDFSLAHGFWILFGAVGPVGFAYYWWEIGIKRGSVNLIATLAYFIPVGSSLLIGLVFKEAMNSGLLPGAILIAIGAWITRKS